MAVISLCLFFLLSRWWHKLQCGLDAEAFSDAMQQELFRREHMMATIGEQQQQLRQRRLASPEELSQLWESTGRLQWSQRDPGSSIRILRELVDFQAEVMHNKQSLLRAEEFVREQPEILVNRIVSHIQYLFEAKTLEGVLPRMNQVYLFTEEMRNFLATARAIVGSSGIVGMRGSGSGAVPNSVLLAEIERRLTVENAQYQ